MDNELYKGNAMFLVDDVTCCALTALLGRITTNEIREILRRPHLAEVLEEQHVNDFCGCIAAFYANQLSPMTPEMLKQEFPEFDDDDE